MTTPFILVDESTEQAIAQGKMETLPVKDDYFRVQGAVWRVTQRIFDFDKSEPLVTIFLKYIK